MNGYTLLVPPYLYTRWLSIPWARRPMRARKAKLEVNEQVDAPYLLKNSAFRKYSIKPIKILVDDT